MDNPKLCPNCIINKSTEPHDCGHDYLGFGEHEVCHCKISVDNEMVSICCEDCDDECYMQT